jgi:ABC-type sugar transport system permease subunit
MKFFVSRKKTCKTCLFIRFFVVAVFILVVLRVVFDYDFGNLDWLNRKNLSIVIMVLLGVVFSARLIQHLYYKKKYPDKRM